MVARANATSVDFMGGYYAHLHQMQYKEVLGKV
jgi:hypothetical protein